MAVRGAVSPCVFMCMQVAWGLSAVCGLGHLAHALGSNAPAWMHGLHSTPLHAALSAVALMGVCGAGLPSLCK